MNRPALLGVLVLAPLLTDTAPSSAQTNPSLPTPGYGRFTTAEVSITLETPDLAIRVMPLGQVALSLLPADAYRSFKSLLDARTDEISRARARTGLDPGLLLVTFYGRSDRARYYPDDINLTSFSGFSRPAAIIPVSPGWDDQRVPIRQTRRAIYVMDRPLNVLEPFTVSYGTVTDDSWGSRLRRIETELARARGRAAADGNN